MNRESHLVAIFNKIAVRAMAAFFVAFAVVIGIVLLPSDNHRFVRILAASALLLMALAALTLLCAMALRDAAANNWRFTLRTLQIATTLVAIGLGLIVWLTREA